jgi:hypothetical protein
MAAKKASPAMDFIVEYLKKNKKAAYADVKAAADSKKLAIFPIMFGRAQALLGYVKMRPRGQGKAAKAAANGVGAAGKRAPGRPRKDAGSAIDTSSFEGIIAAVKGSEQAKARYRAALERIQNILSDAMG